MILNDITSGHLPPSRECPSACLVFLSLFLTSTSHKGPKDTLSPHMKHVLHPQPKNHCIAFLRWLKKHVKIANPNVLYNGERLRSTQENQQTKLVHIERF